MSNLLLEDGKSDRRHRSRLSQLLADTTGIVRIATAYITETQLLSSAAHREVRLLISLAPMDVASGATSLESLHSLIEMGVRCRTLPARPKLHAKVYIFGSSTAVITSANLTTSALESNIEAGAESAGAQVKELLSWFDGLWQAAVPVTTEQIATLQEETAELRRQFARLKRRVRSSIKSPRASKKKASPSDSLQEAFSASRRFFVCNTDRREGSRTATGGFVIEEGMHTRGFAAAWEKFKFPPHMDEVEPGDVIFMFAKSVGIIGVGVAEGTCERLSPKQAGRIATLHPTVEWRIPVRWLVWTDINGAFRWKSNNFTFWNVSDPPYREFREQVMEHFLESE